MTIREWLVDYCYQRGMFENDANAVVDAMMADEANESMNGRWNDKVSDYPRPLLAVLVLSLNRAAVAHIEKNCPKAWYKPLFDGTADDLAGSEK